MPSVADRNHLFAGVGEPLVVTGLASPETSLEEIRATQRRGGTAKPADPGGPTEPSRRIGPEHRAEAEAGLEVGVARSAGSDFERWIIAAVSARKNGLRSRATSISLDR
jgi:hypothetical protein